MQPKPNWTEPTNRIQQVTIDGVACYAFTILKSDPPLPWDVANGNYGPGGRLMNPPQVNRRAELSFAAADPKFKSQGPYNAKPGMLQTWGIHMRFGKGWPLNKGVNHDWKVYWQMHTPDDYSGNGYDGFHGISGHNGFIDFPTPSDPNGTNIFHTPEIVDTWDAHKYLLAIKWSKGADGFVKIADPTKKILAQYNGATFPLGKFGASGEYMYGPLIGLYMDGVSLTSDAILYMAGFEGPLPDVWDGDLTLPGAVVPGVTPPTPPPPTPPTATPAPKWLVDVRNDLDAQLLQADAAVTAATQARDAADAAVTVATQARDELAKAHDALVSHLDKGEDWLK